jgi:hypothetical protein
MEKERSVEVVDEPGLVSSRHSGNGSSKQKGRRSGLDAGLSGTAGLNLREFQTRRTFSLQRTPGASWYG